jgi:hypothetical protein
MRDRDRMQGTAREIFAKTPKRAAAQGNLGTGHSSARHNFAAARDGAPVQDIRCG